MIGYEDHALNFLKQKNELGLTIPFYCGGKNDCLTSTVTKSVPENSLQGTVTFNFDINPKFRDRYLTKYPEASELDIQAAAGAYDGAMYLYDAVLNCPDRDADCVIDHIKNKTNHESVVISNGFGKEGVFELLSRLEVFIDGRFRQIR